MLLLFPGVGLAQNALTTGSLMLSCTFETCSVRAQFTGDANKNASVVVQYKPSSSGTWLSTATQGLLLDERATIGGVANPFTNEARVAIVGLIDNTSYDVRATWTDSDGVSGTNPVTGTISTKTYTPPTGGSTITVTNSSQLNSALGTVNPGQTIHLNPGTYNAFTISRSGNAGAWIVIEGDPALTSIVSGSGVSRNIALSANFIILQHLTLSASDSSGIVIAASAHDLFVQNNVLQNISSLCAADPNGHYNDTGINIGGNVSSVYVLGNTVNSTALSASSCTLSPIYNSPGTGISWVSGTTIVIKGNTVTGGFRDAISADNGPDLGVNVDMMNNTVSGYKDDGVEAKGGNLNVRIQGNVILADKADTCIAGNVPTTPTNLYGPLYVFRNTCRVTTTNPTGTTAYKLGNANSPTYFFHNSIDSSLASPRWDTYVVANSAVALNNIAKSSGSMVDYAQNTSVFDYNVGIVTTGAGYVFHWNNTTDYATWGAWRSATGQESHGLNVDPQFTDTALHVGASSPAVDHGVLISNFNSSDSFWPFSGSAPDIGAFEFVSSAAPTITNVSPGNGPTAGGTSVVITGTNFGGATAVLFGSVAAASFVVNSGTQITATSPAEAASTIDIRVTTPSGTTSPVTADHFTFDAPPPPPPTVTGVAPNNGPASGGTSVTVTGTNFKIPTAATFGGLGCTSIVVNTSTSLTCTSPAHSAATVDVRVSTVDGQSAIVPADQFTYNALPPPPPPTVTSLSPTNGLVSGGTSVVITGTNFTSTTSVRFGATSASFVVNNSTQITATSPAVSNPGPVDVRVTTADGTSAITSGDLFQYNPVPPPPPTVTSIAPATGPTVGGTTVTITGTALSNPTDVKFGTTSGTNITSLSSTQAVADSPAHAAGVTHVTITTLNGTSATGSVDQFTFTLVPPTVTGVSPSTGDVSGGTAVTVTGTGFVGASDVTFGATSVGTFTIVDNTMITTTSPVHGTGVVDVRVTTPNGTSATGASDHFTYTAIPPTVSSVSPNTGTAAGGTVVTIGGSAFANVSAVAFGGVPATSFTFLSPTSIQATVPAHAAGVVDVTVTTPNGTSATSGADHFMYTAIPPTVTSVTPSTGDVSGGTSVTVGGTGFVGTTDVTFSGTSVSSFTVVSDTSLTTTSPAHVVGVTDVQVVTPNGMSATSGLDHFTYTATPPSISSISPNNGTASGGTIVTITGSAFTNVSAVAFGATPATDFTFLGATSLQATAPAHSAGTVDVRVITPNGTSSVVAGDHFTFNAIPPPPVPSVINVTPNNGDLTGGTSVTIFGSAFTGVLGVTFGGTAASSVVLVDDNTLTAVTPAHALGIVDVVVTTNNGISSVTQGDEFTYTQTLLITPPMNIRLMPIPR